MTPFRSNSRSPWARFCQNRRAVACLFLLSLIHAVLLKHFCHTGRNGIGSFTGL